MAIVVRTSGPDSDVVAGLELGDSDARISAATVFSTSQGTDEARKIPGGAEAVTQ